MSFKPIETAPRGEYVLLYAAEIPFLGSSKFEVGTYEQWHLTATHWTHLPPPPESEPS